MCAYCDTNCECYWRFENTNNLYLQLSIVPSWETSNPSIGTLLHTICHNVSANIKWSGGAYRKDNCLKGVYKRIPRTMSSVNNSRTLKMKALIMFETSGNLYLVVYRHFPQERNFNCLWTQIMMTTKQHRHDRKEKQFPVYLLHTSVFISTWYSYRTNERIFVQFYVSDSASLTLCILTIAFPDNDFIPQITTNLIRDICFNLF